MRIRTWILTLSIAVHCFSVIAETHTVTQSGNSFSPRDLTIAVGDTVEWVWTGGSHTVTSGASSSADDVGERFDALLGSSAPLFSFTFTQAGLVPYFCRFHEFSDMKGTVTVESGEEMLDPDNVYVDVSFTGSEIGTENSPFNSIAEAISVANPGATIHIAPGSYIETFNGINAISDALTLQINGTGTVIIGASLPASGFFTRSLPIRVLRNE